MLKGLIEANRADTLRRRKLRDEAFEELIKELDDCDLVYEKSRTGYGPTIYIKGDMPLTVVVFNGGSFRWGFGGNIYLLRDEHIGLGDLLEQIALYLV